MLTGRVQLRELAAEGVVHGHAAPALRRHLGGDLGRGVRGVEQGEGEGEGKQPRSAVVDDRCRTEATALPRFVSAQDTCLRSAWPAPQQQPVHPTCTMPMSLQMSVMRLWLHASATNTLSPAWWEGG